MTLGVLNARLAAGGGGAGRSGAAPASRSAPLARRGLPTPRQSLLTPRHAPLLDLRRAAATARRAPRRAPAAAALPPPASRALAAARAAAARVIPWLLSAVALAAAFLALAPALLSTRAGLRAALAAANAAAPLAVHVATFSGGWRAPVAVTGLRVAAKPPRGAGRAAAAPDAAAATAGPGFLFAADAVRSTAPLGALLWGGHPADVLISHPQIDLTLNAAGEPRLAAALREAGLSPPPLGAPGAPPPARRAAPAPPRAPARVPAALQRVGARVPFSFEARLAGRVTLSAADGELLAPAEAAPLLGARVHVEALAGAAPLGEEAAAEAAEAAAAAGVVGAAPGATAAGRWPAGPAPPGPAPAGVGAVTGPVALSVDSPTLRLRLAGWRTARGYLLLSLPVEAEAELTPAAAAALLGRLNPLLGSAVELRGGARVAAALAPDGGAWPAASGRVRIGAVAARVGRGAALARALDLLSLADARLARAAGAAAPLEVELAPLRARWAADGSVETERADLTLRVPGLAVPLRLASWGRAGGGADGELDMTLAAPRETLAALGVDVSSLPEDYALPLRVRGTAAKPAPELAAASRRLAALLLRSRAARLAGGAPAWVAEELARASGAARADGGAATRLPPGEAEDEPWP
jgi:hypothetical protein